MSWSEWGNDGWSGPSWENDCSVRILLVLIISGGIVYSVEIKPSHNAPSLSHTTYINNLTTRTLCSVVIKNDKVRRRWQARVKMRNL